jgi:xylulokinase
LTSPRRSSSGHQDQLTIGVDIGTSAVKAIAVDDRGRVRARARVPHPVHVAEPDTFEHDPSVAWRAGPLLAVAKLAAAVDNAVALGVAACAPSLAALDEKFLPLSSGLLYGDKRGRVTDPASAGWPLWRDPLEGREGEGFLRWLSKQCPGARAYWPAQALATVALGGSPTIDVFTAMTFHPVFDGVRWDPAALGEFGLTADRMPRVLTELGAPADQLSPGSPAGNPAPITLAAAGVDIVAEQLAVGLTKPGDVHVMCGATLMTWAVMPDEGDVGGLWRIPHGGAGLYLVGGPSNAGGLFLGWVRQLTGGGSAAQAIHPDRIPLWIPYVRGERTPHHDGSLRASMHGLNLTHSPAAVRRAAYEAAGFVVRHHLDLAGCSPSRIVVTGGGVRDYEWMQALADCTNTTVVRSAIPEDAALGMAWLARMAAGLESAVSDAHRWFRVRSPVLPDVRWAEACSRRYETYRAAVSEYLPLSCSRPPEDDHREGPVRLLHRGWRR